MTPPPFIRWDALSDVRFARWQNTVRAQQLLARFSRPLVPSVRRVGAVSFVIYTNKDELDAGFEVIASEVIEAIRA